MMPKEIKESIQKRLEIIALHHGVSVEEVRREIELMIHDCMNSPDPALRAKWASIPRCGDMPTVEEVIVHGTVLTWKEMMKE